jgi:hypothetical protein
MAISRLRLLIAIHPETHYGPLDCPHRRNEKYVAKRRIGAFTFAASAWQHSTSRYAEICRKLVHSIKKQIGFAGSGKRAESEWTPDFSQSRF